MPPTTDVDRRFIDMLSRIVRQSREMQQKGHLRDRTSRAEVEALEHQLRIAKARFALSGGSGDITVDQRAEALTVLAKEICTASDSLRRGAVAAQQESRRIRKRLYRARLINGSRGEAAADSAADQG